MSAAMSMTQLGEVIKHARTNNSPMYGSGGPVVKYVDPHIDNRTGDCFSITFRGYGGEQAFYIMNEHRDNPKSLFERCMTYLNTGRIS